MNLLVYRGRLKTDKGWSWEIKKRERESRVREPLNRHTHARARVHPHTVKQDGDRRNVFELFSLYLSSGYIFRRFQITHIYQNQNHAFRFYFYSAFVCVAAADYVGVEQKKIAGKYVIYSE